MKNMRDMIFLTVGFGVCLVIYFIYSIRHDPIHAYLLVWGKR